MSARILYVEDEPGLRRTVGDLLRSRGYQVATAVDGEQGLERASARPAFDLLLLDLMLPGLGGFEVCRGLRRRGVESAILMLTARGEVSDRVRGLQLGADDYLVKPFDSDELLARIAALLRRAPLPAAASVVAFGDCELDLRAMELCRAGAPVELTDLEYRLLAHLVQRDGQVVSREELLRDVWGFQRPPRTRTVDVHVTWLRAKIEPDRGRPRFLRTVRGAGYKFTRG